ncbi:MAG: InlB B-repeat-containing protein, partial [Bacteroidales bacterium]
EEHLPNPQVYNILFDANGGTGAPTELSKTFSVNIKLPNTLPIREGYAFLGWALSSTATKANFTAGQADITDEHLGKSEGSGGDVSLYAVWTNNYNNWITYYPNDTKLAALCLLGTHNAGSYGHTGFLSSQVKSQNLNFAQQLEWGIRVFDGRFKENMDIYHDVFFCNTSLNDLISSATTFLNNYPKEFVVVLAKAENASGEGAIYNQNFQAVINSYGRNKFVLSDNILTMPIADLRGKIVVVTRDYDQGTLGHVEAAPRISWPDDITMNPTSGGTIQIGLSDLYSVDAPTKHAELQRVLPSIKASLITHPTRWFICYTSGYSVGSLLPNPKGFLNALKTAGGEATLLNSISDLRLGGTIMLDFIEEWNNVRNKIFVDNVVGNSR